jgi:hypothetical protein
MSAASEVCNKSDRLDAEQLSELLRVGSVKTVYHGALGVLTLKELVRNYNSLVEDATRVMLRIKALFRARAIRTPGRSVYSASRREEWLDQLQPPGARVRAASLLTQLDLLLELRPKAKAAMIAEARKQPGWKSLRLIPFLGVVRVAPGDHGHAPSLPHQAQPLAVCGFGGGHPLECRSGVRRRDSPSQRQSTSDTWPEPQSQPDAQVDLQRSSHRCSSEGGTAS